MYAPAQLPTAHCLPHTSTKSQRRECNRRCWWLHDAPLLHPRPRLWTFPFLFLIFVLKFVTTLFSCLSYIIPSFQVVLLFRHKDESFLRKSSEKSGSRRTSKPSAFWRGSLDSQASDSHHQRMRSVCNSEQQQQQRLHHSATNTAANNSVNTTLPQQ